MIIGDVHPNKARTRACAHHRWSHDDDVDGDDDDDDNENADII